MDHSKHTALVLEWLRRWRSITPMEALEGFGCYRLGARIFDLRTRGHNIVNTEPLGKRARYVLIEEAREAA